MRVTTRYYGASDTRGARVVARATTDDGRRVSVTRSYDYALNPGPNHRFAAAELLRRHAPGMVPFYTGANPSGTGYVFAAREAAAS